MHVHIYTGLLQDISGHKYTGTQGHKYWGTSENRYTVTNMYTHMDILAQRFWGTPGDTDILAYKHKYICTLVQMHYNGIGSHQETQMCTQAQKGFGYTGGHRHMHVYAQTHVNTDTKGMGCTKGHRHPCIDIYLHVNTYKKNLMHTIRKRHACIYVNRHLYASTKILEDIKGHTHINALLINSNIIQLIYRTIWVYNDLYGATMHANVFQHIPSYAVYSVYAIIL